MAGTVWRHAASLILSGRGPGSHFSLLMLRRSGKSSHMPGAEVFPGGLVEEVDFSDHWMPLLLSVLPLADFLVQVGRPPTFLDRIRSAPTDPTVQQQQLPPEIGFRIAALRETFEETGVLLVRRPDQPDRPLVLDVEQAEEWREAVHRDPAALLQLANSLSLVPDVWSLYEWSCWLTPTHLTSRRRHDTAFFIANMPHRPPSSADQTESTLVEWRQPAEVLSEFAAGRLLLMPPQLYELSRLQRFCSWQSLQSFSRHRARLGMQHLFPVLQNLADGSAIVTLEGDDFHPTVPDYLGERPPPELPYTSEQLASQSKNVHRSIVTDKLETLCNITPPYGHIAPVLYPAPSQSKL